MSYLTTSLDGLTTEVIAALEGEGFSFDPLTTSFPRYLATVLGEPDAHLTKSVAQMLAEIDAQYGGILSHLRASIAQLLDDVETNIGAGGGGGGYVADAVHFDAAATLNIASLAAPNPTSGFFASSMWLKLPAAAFFAGSVVWIVDPENNYVSQMYLDNSGSSHFSGEIDNADGSSTLSYGTDTVTEDVWLNVKMSAQTDFTAGNKIFQCYFGDTEAAATIGDASAAFDCAFDGLSFWLMDDSYGNPVLCDAADIWIAPGQFIDFSVEANRRKFIDASGKPVDLGADGSTPTGTAPAILFSGDATGFPTNKGTGGVFTLTGSLTNASTSPSD